MTPDWADESAFVEWMECPMCGSHRIEIWDYDLGGENVGTRFHCQACKATGEFEKDHKEK